MQKLSKYLPLAALLAASPAASAQDSAADTAPMVVAVQQINPTTAEIVLDNGSRITVDFYGENIVRLFRDDNGGIVRNPEAVPPADILTSNPRRPISGLKIEEGRSTVGVSSDAIRLDWDKATGLLSVTDLRNGQQVMTETAPLRHEYGKMTMTLAEQPDEYFYGGGVQNGRFSHKGRSIAIENQNSWTDGGVASPAPFYWSTDGYGIMFHTFGKGRYDFGAKQPGTVSLTHNTDYLDAFVMVDDTPVELLNDFYQLTGNPVLIPKFGFYEGHLNAYNRDFWAEDSVKGILFEDGKRYRESQQDNGGIRESLNGELDGNYQFSARAVVDRYADADMPLGWILPNDGYGAGYGQTETLDGNIANLREFGDYARNHGVEIGLWTQSDLHPKDGVSALLQRDIVKEVRDAGVRVLKTDVAWVGDGYSFGLNGVADVGEIMPYYGNDARPFIISLDGWAGTQRYATIWSGDQTGGEWEYIRFHIPTYIGSGLSGQPNITSDMDGIFGGKNPVINTRDFQWKTFTPMQLNMDGWGSNPKYPSALGEPATSINRNYLKLKSELLPYAYTYAREAVDGKPLMRAMMLDYPNAYTLGPSTRYQYLFGPWLLVAPVYEATAAADSLGNDVRHGIYVPEGTWYDYFTGEPYEGEMVLNYFDAPLWKLPVLVKAGAIIPMANPSNNPGEINHHLRRFELYPCGLTEMRLYDDDGTTMRYARLGEEATTLVTSDARPDGQLTVTIHPTEGSFAGFTADKATELIINATKAPKSVTAWVGGRRVKLTQVDTRGSLEAGENVWMYDAAPQLNRFSTPGTPAADVSITKNPQIIVKIASTDVAVNGVTVDVKGFEFAPKSTLFHAHGALTAPEATMPEPGVGPYSLTPQWPPVENADFYEVEFNGVNHSNIRATEYTLTDLEPDTDYAFKLRAVNADGSSPWTPITVRTSTNPLEFAIEGIRGESTAEIQPGFEVARLFDFAEGGDIFHTRYRKNALPFDLIIDLQGVNTLDRMRYLPRKDAGNGTILRGAVAVSLDKEHWTPVDSFAWERNADDKEFVFATQPQARYIRMSVTEGVNNYGTGRELYIFRVPGSEVYLPGDINNDHRIDANDLTSYMNYTGLRQGDPDFEGYVSNGDIDRNGLIDAYDISVVATRLEGGVEDNEYASPLGGTVTATAEGGTAVGDTLTITVTGRDLKSVNAISAVVPYDATVWKYDGITPEATDGMENLTRNRLHADGENVVYPTFVNIGEKPDINADEAVLFTLRFTRLKKGTAPTLKAWLLVDKKLNRLQ